MLIKFTRGVVEILLWISSNPPVDFGKSSRGFFRVFCLNVFFLHFPSHLDYLQDVTCNDTSGKRHQHREEGSCKETGVLNEPKQEGRLRLEVDGRQFDGRREQPNRTDSSADDAHHKGNGYYYPVSTDGSLLILFDELNCLEPLRQLCHELGAVVERRLLSEEEVLYCFIFLHDSQSSIFNLQYCSQLVPAPGKLLLHGILRGLGNGGYLLDAVAVEVEQRDGGALLGRQSRKGEVKV